MTAIDLSNDLGLVACFLLTFNLLLGLFAGVPLQSVDALAHHRFNYFRLHNWTAYVALAVAVAHPVVLLFIDDPKFPRARLGAARDSPQQPVVNTIGAAALYALIFVVTTSYARHKHDAAHVETAATTRPTPSPGCFWCTGCLPTRASRITRSTGSTARRSASRICAGLLVVLGMWRLRRALLSSPRTLPPSRGR